MTWMAFGLICIGAGLATTIWLAFMYAVSKRQQRHDDTVRAVLDKMEGKEGGS